MWKKKQRTKLFFNEDCIAFFRFCNYWAIINGVIDADDQFEAVAKLKQTCPVIIEIEDASGVGQVGNAKCGDIMRISLKIEDDIIKDAMLKVINEQTYDSLVSCGADLVYSFFMGGFLLTAIMTPITYIGVLYMVMGYRRKKEQQ